MYEAVSGARMHAAYYRPGGVYRDLPDRMPQYQPSKLRNEREALDRMNENRQGSLLDFIEDFTDRFPELRRRVRDAAHRQPHLEAAHRRHRRGDAGARDGAGLHRPDAARLGRAVGPAQEAALRGLRPDGLRRAGRRQRRLLRPLPRAHRGDAAVEPHRPAVHRLAARQSRSGDRRQPQGRAAGSRGDEDEHGRADPPLQALHRGHARAAGRGLRGGRASRRASSASTSSPTARTSRTA